MIDIFAIPFFLGIIALLIGMTAWFSVPFFVTRFVSGYVKNPQKRFRFRLVFWSVLVYVWVFLGWFAFRLIIPPVSTPVEPLVDAIRFSTSLAVLVIYVPIWVVGAALLSCGWRKRI